MTGAIALELYKIEAGMKRLEDYRSCFANLSMPMFCFTEPGACGTYHGFGHDWSEWDHIVISKGVVSTIGDLIEYMLKHFKAEVSMINFGEKMLYMGFGVPVWMWKRCNV